MKKFVSLIAALIIVLGSYAQQVFVDKINPDLLIKPWNAKWINHPTTSATDYGVFNFRKTFSLNEVPGEFIIHVSADNRYKLFVNGKFVCLGPSRGDQLHWRFESVDISSFLQKGDNLVAAVVWNYAEQKPWAQISYKTGFILQGNSSAESFINTNDSWKVVKNEAFSPSGGKTSGGQFIVVGPCDRIDASLYPWNWEQLAFDDSNWKNAKIITWGQPREAGTGIEWGLEPRQIPFMELIPQEFANIRRSSNIEISEDFLRGNNPITIKANQHCSFLLDQKVLTTAYPKLLVSGGKGSDIKLTYSEALFDDNNQKGNRNEIEGKHIDGYSDTFIPDGADSRLFEPLWFRTWRYVLVEINTSSEPLIINKLTSEFTAYPLEENAAFISDQTDLSKIWDVGWHTARLCAGETYFDCPYYEQLQYVGDTRIQALVSLYVSGDDRLIRNAIQLLDNSRISEGLTTSRYPTSIPQVIPPFSLYWVNMIHDYWMHRDDPEFVISFMDGMDQVLNWFIQRVDPETGILGRIPYWNFVDWANEWFWDGEKAVGGIPKGGYYGQSSILTMHLAYTAKHAAELHRYFGENNIALKYERIASDLLKATKDQCWDESKNYIADTPEKTDFSMHAQIFAVLTDLISKEEQADFVERFKDDKSLIQATMYFRFYLTRCLQKTSLGDEYLSTLGLWHEMLANGLTTFAEKPDPTRSDCHAWSASPNYDFLSLVAGIRPAEPGFKSVVIEPNMGDLKNIEGKMPHPNGMINFKLKRVGINGIKGTIDLPGTLTGTFRWKGNEISLKKSTIIDL
ncbi:alpha-L-rhamnosidase-related protein [Sunxiuqinia sp. A32]|uniref:alpha-L-rhamnosidase-related protein n=1 Tax=Sunxiuqinia sp. A32 TaxID=3461496 RepID=UPI00404627BE